MVITPQQSVRRGLRVDDFITQFKFTPSVGIRAGQIDKLGLDIRSFREPLKRAIQQVLAPSFLKNFDQAGRPDKWEPLSDATLDIRSRQGATGDSPLIRSGLLRKTMGQLNIWDISITTAAIRALPDKISYGYIHQAGYGGSGVGKKMSGYMKKAGGDAKEAQHLLDDDLIMAMRTGSKVGGDTRTATPIPQRQFVMIQNEDYDEIEKIFVDWMMERARRSGLITLG